MKPSTKIEYVYWTKYHGHHNDEYYYNYEKYKGNDYKVRKRRYYKALRRASKKIIKQVLLDT